MINTNNIFYDFSPKVLQKWVTNRLIVKSENSVLKINFNIVGSTCSNMGWPIIFSTSFILEAELDKYIIKNAALEFTEDQGYKKMCYFQTDNLPENVLKNAPFSDGEDLKSAISKVREQPPSGCLCTQKKRKYFWNIALQTTLFYLNNTNIKTVQDEI